MDVVDTIRSRRNEPYVKLAKEFNVDPSLISRVCNYYIWPNKIRE